MSRMTSTASTARRAVPPPPLFLVLLVVALTGCRSGSNGLGLWNSGDTDHLVSTDHIQGPLERMVHATGLGRAKDDSPWDRNAGRPEFEEAEQLYQAGDYKAAEKAFKKIARQYKNAPVREDALFMLAESQFQQERYSWAQDSYDRLVKDYPSTRYLDTYARRQFEIARYWLQSPDVVTADAIQPVNFEDIKSTPTPKASRTSYDPSRVVPIFPNFFDRTRPWFDTDGRALQALKSVWMNDPTGPLAADALMLTASHYVRRGDWVEADRIYSILREEYPKSRHLENSFVIGSFVKLMSYDGPAYDGTRLEEARQLKESTLRIYPQHEDRERMLEEIRQIDEARARHVWEMVRYYQKKNKPRAVAIYCQVLLEKHPDSTFADQARQTLMKVDPLHLRELGIRAPAATVPLAPTPTAQDSGPPGRARLGNSPGRARL